MISEPTADENRKAAKRREIIFWTILLLVGVAADLLVRWLVGYQPDYYLLGLVLAVGILRRKEESRVPRLWWLRLAIVVLMGGISIAILVSVAHFWRNHQDFTSSHSSPNPVYAQMVAGQIATEINTELSEPEAIYHWRTTGRLDEPLEFPRPVRFWFTYNQAADSFAFYRPEASVSAIPTPPDWSGKLKPILVPLLQEKQNPELGDNLTAFIDENMPGCRLRGRIYQYEPRVVAAVFDTALFYQEVASIFRKVKHDVPHLYNFTTFPKPETKSKDPSRIVITLRDSRDSVLAQLGSPGDGRKGSYEYRQKYQVENLNGTVEAWIPYYLSDDLFFSILKKAGILLAYVWIGTVILWAKTEWRFSRYKKKPPEDAPIHPE